MSKKQKKSEWHLGSPPHIGWWNASVGHNTGVWRWWNGSRWSLGVHETQSSGAAASHAKHKAYGDNPLQVIRWRMYYPANARVPRINPETGK
jgi:hypothetical protein